MELLYNHQTRMKNWLKENQVVEDCNEFPISRSIQVATPCTYDWICIREAGLP